MNLCRTETGARTIGDTRIKGDTDDCGVVGCEVFAPRPSRECREPPVPGTSNPLT